MIKMNAADMHDQAGMERAFAGYLRDMYEQCPGTFNTMLRPRFTAMDRDRRTLRTEYDPEPWMANPGGIVHGGVIAAMADIAMGLLSRYVSGGVMTPTINMQVNYLQPMGLTDHVVADCVCTMSGSTVCAVNCVIFSAAEPERPLVTASAVYHVSRVGRAEAEPDGNLSPGESV